MCWEMDYQYFAEQKKAQENKIKENQAKEEQRDKVIAKLLDEATRRKGAKRKNRRSADQRGHAREIGFRPKLSSDLRDGSIPSATSEVFTLSRSRFAAGKIRSRRATRPALARPSSSQATSSR